MGWPPGLCVVNEELLRLSPAELSMLWGAMCRARWTRPALFRQRVSAMGRVRVTTAFVETTTAPAVVLSVVEDLVREGRLSRTKATRIEERTLASVDRHGCWQGNPWDGRERLGVLPPDVERLASIGA